MTYNFKYIYVGCAIQRLTYFPPLALVIAINRARAWMIEVCIGHDEEKQDTRIADE